MTSATYFVLAAALLAIALADIKFDPDTNPDKVVLASFGSASATIFVLVRGTDSAPSVSASRFYSVGTISPAEGPNGYTNYTIPFSFDGDVGTAPYTVSVDDDSVSATFIIAGFVIKDSDGRVVSGDDGDGVSVGQSGSTTYDVNAVGTDGQSVDISGTSIAGREMTGPYLEEIDMEDTIITSTTFVLAITTYRVGTGRFMVLFESSAIQLGGESFETVLNVRQATSPVPPCVAIGGAVTASDGYVSVPFYNLLTPPRDSPVDTVTMTINSVSVNWDPSRSSLALPDQVAVFPTSGSGEATFTCDGEDAAIMGGDVIVDGGSVPLASDNVGELPTSDTQAVLTAVIRVLPADIATFPLSEAQKIIDQFCSVIGSSDCVLFGLSSGSVIHEVAGLVDEDQASDAEDALTASFEDCAFQTNTGYECDEVELGSVSINAVAGGATPPVSAAAGAGLATWTIILIAVVGAFALILVIVLGLWAVYRRSAEQSESDYSSSGPLGVPDPSDLLYEQSIVRDIYGRGDFPDGGPSQAVAEQRAREADLREEFPRPPSSSSGVSRGGAATDDASSTYSV